MNMAIYREISSSPFCFKEKTVANYSGLESPHMTKVYIGADFNNTLKNFIGKIKNFRIYSDTYSLISRVSFRMCLPCEVGYYYNEVNNKCLKCHSVCLKCLNHRITSCISCIKGFSLLVKQNLDTYSIGICLSNCPKGFKKEYPYLNEQSSFKQLIVVAGRDLNQTSNILIKHILPIPYNIKNGFILI